MRYFILMLICLTISLQAKYDDHVGGSGTLKNGTLVIAGDDIFATRDEFTRLQQKYNLVGQAPITNIENRFKDFAIFNQSSKGILIEEVQISGSADGIILAYGLSDLKAQTLVGDFVKNYKKLINSLRQNFTKIYICSISPVQPWADDYSIISANLPSYNKALTKLAQDQDITLIDLYEVNAENPKYFVDGIQPVLYGSQFIADRIYKVVSGDIETSMPFIFSDNMILQRRQETPIFGRTTAGSEVTVTWNDSETKVTQADSHGFWMVKLSAKEADHQGKTLTVQAGTQKFTYTNVLIGDVWLAAGQSNMASVPVRKDVSAKKENVSFPPQGYPNIRILQLSSPQPAAKRTYNWSDDFGKEKMPYFQYYTPAKGGWFQADSYATIQNVSAVAWFFTKQIHLDYNVPVGIIQSCIGGTSIESYIPHKAFFDEPEIISQVTTKDEERGGMLSWVNDPKGADWAQEVAAIQRSGLNRNDQPLAFHPMEHSYLYRSGIQPFIPFALSGAIWYQGESNANIGLSTSNPTPTPLERNTAQYRALVRGWRQAWSEASGTTSELPFLSVQLPVIGSRPSWPWYRDAQFKFWQDDTDGLDRIGLAIVLEYGASSSNVHPYEKAQVAQRLARLAHYYAYGETGYFYSGPVALGIQVNDKNITVNFKSDTLAKGLQAYKKGSELKYFEVADKYGIYQPATAELSDNSVIVSSPKVKEPVAIRYFWDKNPLGNNIKKGAEFMLASSDGQTILPASPFRFGEEKFQAPKGLEAADSQEFTDKFNFSGSQLPAHWRMNNKGQVINKTTENGLLIQTDTPKANSFLEIGADGQGAFAEISKNGRSFSIEARLKVHSGNIILAPDNKAVFSMAAVTPEKIVFAGESFAGDNKSDFITLRFTYQADLKILTLYRNGIKLKDQTNPKSSSRNRFFIGEGSGKAIGSTTIAHIRYTIGAFQPISGPSMQIQKAEVDTISDKDICLKVTCSQGRSLDITSLGLSVDEKAKTKFSDNFSKFKVFHNTQPNFKKATKISGVTADTSDVALYGGFSCEFQTIRLQPGINYIWLTVKTSASLKGTLNIDTINISQNGKNLPAYKIK